MHEVGRAEEGWIRNERIADLAELVDDWDSYGAEHVTDEALAVLRNLCAVPLKDGGIQIEWHCSGWDVEVEVNRHGVPVAFYSEKQER